MTDTKKYMTFGEGGTALALGALAMLSLVVGAKAYTPEYAFHASLFAIGSAAAAFAIFNRYFDRPVAPAAARDRWQAELQHGSGEVLTVAAMFWGIAGFTVGIYAALESAFPGLNFDLPWLSFGRIRPLHTSAVIFAFGGNVLIATSFYVVQRTCRARLVGDIAPWFVVLGYNFFILIAGTGYLLGITQSKEYAEPEWYADLWLTVVWVAYFLVFLGTIMRRKEPHIYVANWFYLAFILTIAVLHLVNNAAIPVSLFSPKSYIVWAGVQDAMVQWWYGHNAVGFFLTAGFLAIMYYFIPKALSARSIPTGFDHPLLGADLPLHLGRSAPPALHRTAGLGPDARHDLLDHPVDAVLGRHDQRPDDAVGRVGQAAHRSGAAHDGGLGRVLRHGDLRRTADVDQGSQLAVALYRLDRRPCALRRARLGRLRVVRGDLLPRAVAMEPPLYSLKLVNWHFWISTIGIVLYITAMWVSGILQGLMWRAYTSLGFLEYSFIETVEAMHPFYVIRALGGALFLAGALLMVWNLWQTVNAGRPSPRSRPGSCRRSEPMSLWSRHAIFEKNSIALVIGVLMVIAIGGLVEVAPLFYLKSTIEKVDGMRPYTPLELAGRNIYVREGCYNCHSQMIRSLRDEVERYGHYSLAAESMYDRPFQWGSKRTGPDLARSAGNIPTSGIAIICVSRSRSCPAP